jgi:hypothetical protein
LTKKSARPERTVRSAIIHNPEKPAKFAHFPARLLPADDESGMVKSQRNATLTTGNLMPGREETWQHGKMRRRKSFGSSMMIHVATFTSTPPC